jgi:hypothetical protein
MKPTKAPWIGDISRVVLGVCLFLPVDIINRQYKQAAANKVLLEGRSEAAGYPEKYNNTLLDKTRDKPIQETHSHHEEQAIGTFPDKTQNLPSPEIDYRRKVAVGNLMLGFFLLLLLGGLTARRWVGNALIVILWVLTWHLQA